MKMLFGRQHCPCCGRSLDIALDECPKCHAAAPSDTRVNRRMLWLDPVRQLLLLVIGYGGFQALGYIFAYSAAAICLNMCGGDKDMAKAMLSTAKVVMLNQVVVYSLLLVFLFIVVFPYLSKIADQFKSVRRLLKGLSYGVLVIGLTVCYNVILNFFYKTGGNNNESTLTVLTKAYPWTALLVFGLIGPICEEFTYRVGLFNFLSRFNRIVAYCVTIVIFALIHFDFQCTTADQWINELANLPSYLIAAGIFCYAYEKDGFSASLYAHTFNNLVSVLLIIISMAVSQ